MRVNLPGSLARPHAPLNEGLTILEVQIGASEEGDIDRISEDSVDFAEEVEKRFTLISSCRSGKLKEIHL